jgi:hypothetical protein
LARGRSRGSEGGLAAGAATSSGLVCIGDQSAIVQIRRPSAGQAYCRRKLAEGKSLKKRCAA